jgi:hypothetical protein
MKPKVILLGLAIAAFTATCGFGLYGDDGAANPSPDYWGWRCADGTTPDPDAGCLPQTCDDSSSPTLEADGGFACVCADGTAVLVSSCCDDGSTPTFETGDAGPACVCADGTDVPGCSMPDGGN